MKNSYDYCATDVSEAYKFYFNYLLSKLDEIFIWKGKIFEEKEDGSDPDVDVVFLDHLLYLTGKACLSPVFNGIMRCLNGNVGGEQTGYYLPSIITVANPIYGDKQIGITDLNREGIMVYNSKADIPYTLYPLHTNGLFNLIKQTATMLADNVVSINVAQINTRVQVIATAETPALANSAELQLKSMYAGKPYTVVKENMVNKININPIATSSKTDLTQLTELQQFIVAQFFNAIGIKSNAINKKERLITDEINYIDDYLAISLDSMLESRVKFCKKFNAIYGEEFGTIDVELNPILKPVIKEAVSEDNNCPKETAFDEVVESEDNTVNESEDETAVNSVENTTVEPLVDNSDVDVNEDLTAAEVMENESNECSDSESESDPELSKSEDKEEETDE